MNFEIIPNQQTPKATRIYQGFPDDLRELEAFLEFAKTQHRGVGLSANQVSLDGERFMFRAFALRDLNTGIWSLVLDPHIEKFLGIKEEKAEGCLTWKGKVIIAERYRTILVAYSDTYGLFTTHEMHRGFEAQIWQHEIDHLNGVEEKVLDPFEYNEPKPLDIGRNEKCPCGSGLKYKHCCLIDE
jgi:peptide deformylase